MKRYVTDLIGNEYLSWNKDHSYLISTPTGSGKTTFVIKKLLKHAVQQDMHMVYICNRRVLNDQFAVQADNKITDLFQEEDGITAEMARKHLHIFTYQSLETARTFPPVRIDDTFSGHKRLLTANEILYYIFDEAHYIVSDAAFNSNTNFWIDRALNAYTPHSIFVYLTATPEPLIAFFHSSYILGIEMQESLHRCYVDRRKRLGKEDKIIYDQVSKVLNDFADASKKAALSLTLPDKEIILKHIKSATDDTLDSLYNKLTYALLNPTTGATNIKEERLHIYTYEPDYSHITPLYFKKFEHLIEEIASTEDQKWLIFIDNEKVGKKFMDKLKEADIKDIGFLSRHEIDTSRQAQDIYQSIVTTESFPCRILITTTVLDCGINIHDKLVKNIVLAADNKTSFLQMLGRRRTDDGEHLRLFIKSYLFRDINARYEKYKDEIKTLNRFSLKNHTVPCGDSIYSPYKAFLPKGTLSNICRSFNAMPSHLWYTAVSEIEQEVNDEYAYPGQKESKKYNTDLVLHGINYSKTGYLYRLLQLQEYRPAIENYKTYSAEYCDLLTYIQSCITVMNEILDSTNNWRLDLFFDIEFRYIYPHIFKTRDALIRKYKDHSIQEVSAKASVSKSFFLDQQLAWIGKTYDFYNWYRSDMHSLIEFLISNATGAPLEPETFSKEFLELMKALPEPPPSIKKDMSRYKDGKVPGKKKIEKALKELGIPCEIRSVQKQVNKERKTFWHLSLKYNVNTSSEPPQTP